MATKICTFTADDGTALEDYSASGEATFTENSGVASGSAVITDANRVRPGTAGATSVQYVDNWTPATADYSVEVDILVKSYPNANGTLQAGVGVRCGTSAFTGYYALMESRSGPTTRIALYRGGNGTPLGTYDSGALDADDTLTLGLAVDGNDIVVSINGTPVISVTASGANIIESTGVPSLYFQGALSHVSNTTGFHLDNFEADDGAEEDAGGFTTITPSVDTRTVYYSTTGDDENDGLTDSTPKGTLLGALGLLRNGYPDWLLFKRGDTFSGGLGAVAFGGRSATEPLLFGAYGTGERPIIEVAPDTFGFRVSSTLRDHYIVFRDIELKPSTPGDGLHGISLVSNTVQYFLLENCKISGFAVNVLLEGAAGTVKNVTVRRCVIEKSCTLTGHSQGLYAFSVAGLTIEECLFDHNGWDESVEGADQTIYNHNLYIQSNCSGFIFRNNISANASSHGLQARAGGDVYGNLFIDNPLHMSYGLQNSGDAKAGGVSGNIYYNVYIGARDIGEAGRGWAIEFGNTRPISTGGGTTFAHNVIYNASNSDFAAIQIAAGNPDDSPDDVGINDLTIRDNIVYGWHSCLRVVNGMVPGGTGRLRIAGLVVKDNDFQAPHTGPLIAHEPAFDSDYETFSGNRYYWSASNTTWFSLAGSTVSLATWTSTVEADAVSEEATYTDPTLDAGDYNGTRGGTATEAAFLTDVAGRAADAWYESLTALLANKYVAEEGFDETGWPTGYPPEVQTIFGSDPPQYGTVNSTGLLSVYFGEDVTGWDTATIVVKVNGVVVSETGARSANESSPATYYLQIAAPYAGQTVTIDIQDGVYDSVLNEIVATGDLLCRNTSTRSATRHQRISIGRMSLGL